MTDNRDTTPSDIIGRAAVHRLTLAGFDIVARQLPEQIRHRFTCPMCGYSECGGPSLDAFADWSEIWHRGCVSLYMVSPTRRGRNRPMVHTVEVLS